MKWDAYDKKRHQMPPSILKKSSPRKRVLITLLFLFTISTITEAQSITLSLKNVPIETAFKQIQSQSGYAFVYTTETIQDVKPVSLSFKNASLKTVLSELFLNQPLTYQLQDGFIMIRKKEGEEKKPSTHDISGVILTQTGQPLQGATVLVKGKNKATATDEQGRFYFSGIEDHDVLVVSSIGFHRQEFTLSGQTFVQIRLDIAVSALDQTVVIAYGATTKRMNTGDVSSLKGSEIEKQPVSNPLAAMEGRMPGVLVTQQTGVPGGGLSVQIRGINSLRNDGNAPLYIVDGVPLTATSLVSPTVAGLIIPGASSLGDLDPNDIERIDVLKDADATAIYGSRGANGVVLITTKKGKAGKTTVDLNTYSGISQVGHFMDLLSTPQYLHMRHEAFFNDNGQPQPWDYDLMWDSTRQTDWQKKLIGHTAPVQDIQLSLSGGNLSTQFLLSGDYHREGTVFPGDFSDQKRSAHLHLTHQSPNQKLRLTISSSYILDNSNLPREDLTAAALTLPPLAPNPFTSTGDLYWTPGFSNPYAELLKTYNGTTDHFYSNALLSYQIFHDLELSTSFGYNALRLEERSTVPAHSWDPSYRELGASYWSSQNVRSWIVEPQLQYKKQIQKGKLEVLLGTTFQQSTRDGQTLAATGYSSDALLQNLQAAPSVKIMNASYTQYRYNGLFARLNYNYQNRYLLNLTGRRDGSSRFGPDRQFANFGAAGAGWIFSEEPFLPRNTFFSYGKLRASYGTTGNDQIGDYGFMDTYSTTRYPYQGSTGLIPSRLVNPDFSWEKTQKLEGGLELGFLRNQLLVSANYYHNCSSNQLVGYALPVITGQPSIQFNFPATLQNTGWELEAGYTPVTSKGFSWSSQLNITIPRNKLVSFPGIESSSYNTTYQVGAPLSVYMAYHNLGVDPQTGMYIFTDENRDGSPDLLALKKIAQDFYGGFQNTLKYGGLELDLLFQFVRQSGRNYRYAGFGMPGTIGNQPTVVLDRWQKPGQLTIVQKFSQDYASDVAMADLNDLSSDHIVSDASFIRLKNLSLAWKLPPSWLRKMKAQSFRLFLLGQNLWTLTRYQGLDPENQNATALPPLRVITLGLHATF